MTSTQPSSDAPARVLQRTPRPKPYIGVDSAYEVPEAALIWCGFHPDHQGISRFFPVIAGADGQGPWNFEVAFDSGLVPEPALINHPVTQQQEKITFSSIFDRWSSGYDFARVYAQRKFDQKPTVAFALRWCVDLCGGILQVRKFAEWFCELGFEVTLYCDMVEKPDWWGDLAAKFHGTLNAFERYPAIQEDIVIFYSSLDLPFMHLMPGLHEKLIFHFCQGVEAHHWGNSPERLLCDKPIFHLVHSLPIGRIVPSRHLEEYFASHYGQETFTVLNGIDLSTFTFDPERIKSGVTKLLTVGKPTTFLKGGESLFKALTLFCENHPHRKVELTIISGTDFEEDERQKISKLPFHCIVKTGLSKTEMHAEYCAAHCYINASLYEGFGLPSIEAMASGTPVVQTENQGLAHIAIDGVNCLTVPPYHPRKLADAIARVVLHPDQAAELIRNGRATAETLSEENQKQMFREVVRSLVGNKLDLTPLALTLLDPVPVKESALHKESLTSSSVPQIMEPPTTQSPITQSPSTEHGVQSVPTKPPKFSVLMPTYNQARYLPYSIASVLNQQYEDWELLITNDGSTDDTQSVISEFAAADERIRIFTKENGGTGSALNHSLKQARGEWICWLSSDDAFQPDTLATFAQESALQPAVKFFNGNYFVFYEATGKTLGPFEDRAVNQPSPQFQVIKLFESDQINGITICIHREVFDEIGLFREDYPTAQDFDMWLRIALRHPWHFINHPIGTTRFHELTTAVAFPDAGVYDSTRALVECLNNHTFKDLFPWSDLTQPDSAFAAVIETLKIATNNTAFIYRGVGPYTGLLTRMSEWLTNECHAEVRALLIKSAFEPVLKVIQTAPYPRPILEAIRNLAQGQELVYEPVNPLQLMRYEVERLLPQEEGQKIERYLEKVRKISDRDFSTL